MKELPLLAGRLKTLRETKELSQQALAMHAGLSVSVVSQIEQGKKPDPRASTLIALASALGVSLDELAGISEAEPEARKAKRRK